MVTWLERWCSRSLCSYFLRFTRSIIIYIIILSCSRLHCLQALRKVQWSQSPSKTWSYLFITKGIISVNYGGKFETCFFFFFKFFCSIFYLIYLTCLARLGGLSPLLLRQLVVEARESRGLAGGPLAARRAFVWAQRGAAQGVIQFF
jgi:hypothetical protein